MDRQPGRAPAASRYWHAAGAVDLDGRHWCGHRRPSDIGSHPNPAAGGPAAPPQTRDERYFTETGFRIGNDAFWNFFNSRGGVETFGFPVSRVFGFLGCPVQIFQRLIMQQCGNTAPVALLNLLDPGLFPYTRVNGSVFPGLTMRSRTPRRR